MEKRSINKWDSIMKDDEFSEEDQVKLESPTSVWLRSQYPDKVIAVGSVTGNRYVFDRGGSEVLVDSRDAPEMLGKIHGMNPCCGRAIPMYYFTEVGG